VLVGALFGREGARDPRQATEQALAVAQLSLLAGEVAASLPVGHLRRLEFARALATRPRVILADEPCAGLNRVETVEMMAMLQAVRPSCSSSAIWKR
jgi:ABC-type branched-subunit amino acid transport system ATPase component